MLLSIEQYGLAEHAAYASLSARAIQAFSPVTFRAIHYPDVARQETELRRYVDAMHEDKEAKYFKPALWRYSKTEATVVADVAGRVVDLTKRLFGKPTRPWMGPLAAVQMWRTIEALGPVLGNESPSVFEIGPGSGYLGAILIKTGHPYGAMDNCQGFYLWQNRLFSEFAGDDFLELGGEGIAPSRVLASVYHMPWWQFADIRASVPAQCDVFVCDHALAEMSSTARRFMMRAASLFLAGSGPKVFLFSSIGKPETATLMGVVDDFTDLGFVLIAFGSVFAFCPKASELARYAVNPKILFRHPIENAVRKRIGFNGHGQKDDVSEVLLSLRSGIPEIGGDGLVVSGEEIIPLNPEESGLDYEFLACSGIEVPHFRWDHRGQP